MFALGVRRQSEETLRKVVDEALKENASGGPRAANQLIVDQIGLQALPVFNDEYYQDALHFHLGLILAHVGDVERAVQEIVLSNTLPGSDSSRLFSDHVPASLLLDAQRRARAKLGIPTFMIAAMPRAASTSLTQTIAATLDLPLLRVSIGRMPSYAIVPSWLRACLPGGAVLHDHFGAIPLNIRTLLPEGVRHVFVLIRDPRASAVSFWGLDRATGSTRSESPQEDKLLEFYENALIPWVKDWFAVANDPASELKVSWITYPEIRADTTATATRVIALYRRSHHSLRRYARLREAVEVKSNFLSGNDEAWRSLISDAGRERMWAALPADVIKLLGLQP